MIGLQKIKKNVVEMATAFHYEQNAAINAGTTSRMTAVTDYNMA